ncbi:MAG TPA: c-type cytochrome [Casimicrobiaceae bacterium]|nr:c-type cytochrome [Casimicrobiaceae bacterium]
MLQALHLPTAACAVVIGLVLAAYPAGTLAQAGQSKDAAADDLRPAYANAQDIAEGKRVAETSCAACHGANGISTTKGIPNLAGQRAPYLYLELKAYKSGARSDESMTNAVKFLSNDALVKAAAYFGSLDPAQPATVSSKAAPAKSDPVQAGKAAAAGCAGCHGDAGVTKTPGMPSLVGLDQKYLVAAMKAYKSGQRKHDMMKNFVSALSDSDMNNIALHYALQKPARAQTPAAGDKAAGKSAAGACAGCHGEQGVSTNPANPSLAGQDAQYLAAALQEYKDGVRSDETMKALAAPLDESAMKNIAAHYANQQPQPPKVQKPLTASDLAQRCDRCHGPDGNSTDPRMPALAAQRVDYLENVLRAYQKGARKSSAMAAMSEVLSDSDVESLATYYSGKKGRAVMYITLPAK